jgi:hypothetical protein
MVAGQKLALWCNAAKAGTSTRSRHLSEAQPTEENKALLAARTNLFVASTGCKANGDSEVCEYVAESVAPLEMKLAHVAQGAATLRAGVASLCPAEDSFAARDSDLRSVDPWESGYRAR